MAGELPLVEGLHQGHTFSDEEVIGDELLEHILVEENRVKVVRVSGVVQKESKWLFQRFSHLNQSVI